MKHFNDVAKLAERAIGYYEAVTGAAPVVAPALVTDGAECRSLSSVIVKVTADQNTGLNCKLTITPWIWGKTRDGVASTSDLGWSPLTPVVVDCLVSQPLSQVFEVNCGAGDRIYLQITASNPVLAWATAEVFAGLRHRETQPVAVHGLAADILSAINQNKAMDFVQVADVTNGADGMHDYYIDRKAGHRSTGFLFIIDPGSGPGVTCTIEATMQNDGTADAACEYGDVTVAIAGAATVVATGMFFNEQLLGAARYIHVHVIANTGGANDADWNIQYGSA